MAWLEHLEQESLYKKLFKLDSWLPGLGFFPIEFEEDKRFELENIFFYGKIEVNKVMKMVLFGEKLSGILFFATNKFIIII